MESDHIAEVLRLHRQAYELLLWLDRQASLDPCVLSEETVSLLGEAGSCADWLAQHRSLLPEALVPTGNVLAPFAALLSSFFSVSFEVRRFEFGGRLLDARLQRGRTAGPTQVRNVEVLLASTVRRLLAGEGVRLSNAQVRSLVRRTCMHDDVRIVAYVHELDRRARGRSKGPIVHRLWRTLPPVIRKTLDVFRVQEAMRRIRSEARKVIAFPEEM